MPRAICFRAASGCSADTAMSRSDIARTRDQSVLDVFEEDRLLMFRRLAKRDDANLARSFRVDDGDYQLFQNAESDKSLLRIVEPIVFEGVGRALEHFRRINKIEAVLPKIQVALCCTPRESHVQVYIQNDYASILGGGLTFDM